MGCARGRKSVDESFLHALSIFFCFYFIFPLSAVTSDLRANFLLVLDGEGNELGVPIAFAGSG